MIFVTKNKSVHFAEGENEPFIREIDVSNPKNFEKIRFIIQDLAGIPISTEKLKERVEYLEKREYPKKKDGNPTEKTDKEAQTEEAAKKVSEKKISEEVLYPIQDDPDYKPLGEKGLAISHIPGTTKIQVKSEYGFKPQADEEENLTADQVKGVFAQQKILPRFDAGFLQSLAGIFIPKKPKDPKNPNDPKDPYNFKFNLNSPRIDPVNGNVIEFETSGGSIPNEPGKLELLITNPDRTTVGEEDVHVMELSKAANPNIPVSKELVVASNRYLHNNRFYPVNFGRVRGVPQPPVSKLTKRTITTPPIDVGKARENSANLEETQAKYRNIDTTISLGTKSMLAGGLIGGIGGGLIGGASAPILDPDKKRSKLKKILRGMMIGGAAGSILGGITGGTIGTSTGILSPGAASILDHSISVEGLNGLKDLQGLVSFKQK